MSSANLQGKNFDFNLSVIAQGVDNETEITPIDIGALSYLEIEDSLTNTGVVGSVAIKNSYNIMDRLQTFRSTEKKLYLDINIEDTDSASKSISDKKISLSTILENSSIIAKNITDNIIVFSFEEAQTSMLKKLSMRKLWEKGSVPDKSPSNTIGGHVHDILQMWSNTLPGKNINLIESSFFKGGKNVNLQSFWHDIEDSVFDVLTRLVENIQIDDYLPIFKIQNIDDEENLTRKFTLGKMFTESHHEFLEAQKSGKDGIFSDVYLEEFVLSPQEDKTGGLNSSGIYNTVEEYDLVKADIKTAREGYWCDYMLNEGAADLTTTEITALDFTDIVDSFEKNDLTGLNSAITVLKSDDKKILKEDRIDESLSKDNNDLLTDQINNKVKRSFLFLNDAIVFNVRGQMFRKPGTFITINGGDVIGRNSPDNIWFVVSVKHKFRELDYENEVVAVRLFGNSDQYVDLVSQEQQSFAGVVDLLARDFNSLV